MYHLGGVTVDADAMGRAFPEAQMNSFAIGDLPMFPQTLCDPRGLETVVAKVPTWIMTVALSYVHVPVAE